MLIRRAGPLPAVLLVALLLAGCGDGYLKTRGRLVENGAPFKPDPDAVVRVVFVPLLPDGQRPGDVFIAAVDQAAMTFQVTGKDGRGMPPGKYKILVTHELNKKDLFKGKFFGRPEFTQQVDSGTGEIVLDLGGPAAPPPGGKR